MRLDSALDHIRLQKRIFLSLGWEIKIQKRARDNIDMKHFIKRRGEISEIFEDSSSSAVLPQTRSGEVEGGYTNVETFSNV